MKNFKIWLKWTFNRVYMIQRRNSYLRFYPNPGFQFRLFGICIHLCKKHGLRIK